MNYVTVFHKKYCQPCRITMKMLDRLGVPYVARSLEDGSPEAERALAGARALGLTAAPIVEVRDGDELVRTISGYDTEALREIAEAVR